MLSNQDCDDLRVPYRGQSENSGMDCRPAGRREDLGQGTEYGGIVDHATDAVTRGASTLILLTGIRSAEACGLDAADVHAVERLWSRVRRKGRWTQNIAVNPTVARALRRAIGHRETGPVLIWQGKRLSENRPCAIGRNAAQAVGARSSRSAVTREYSTGRSWPPADVTPLRCSTTTT